MKGAPPIGKGSSGLFGRFHRLSFPFSRVEFFHPVGVAMTFQVLGLVQWEKDLQGLDLVVLRHLQSHRTERHSFVLGVSEDGERVNPKWRGCLSKFSKSCGIDPLVWKKEGKLGSCIPCSPTSEVSHLGCFESTKTNLGGLLQGWSLHPGQCV